MPLPVIAMSGVIRLIGTLHLTSCEKDASGLKAGDEARRTLPWASLSSLRLVSFARHPRVP